MNKEKVDLQPQATNEEEYKEISLFKNPIETTKYLVILIIEQLQRFMTFLKNHFIFVFIIAASIYFMNFVKGPHSDVIEKFIIG